MRRMTRWTTQEPELRVTVHFSGPVTNARSQLVAHPRPFAHLSPSSRISVCTARRRSRQSWWAAVAVAAALEGYYSVMDLVLQAPIIADLVRVWMRVLALYLMPTM